MKQIVPILIFLILFSCDAEKKSNQQFDLRIIMDVKVKKNTTLQLFYRSKEQPITRNRSFNTKIDGSNEFKKIKYKINGLLPYILIDLGDVENQELEIESIVFKYKDKSYTIKKDKISSSFKTNKWIKIQDSLMAKYKIVKVNNKKTDPKLILKNSISNEILSKMN